MKAAAVLFVSMLALTGQEFRACSTISFPPTAMPPEWILVSGIVTGHPVEDFEGLGLTPGVQIAVQRSSDALLSDREIRIFPLGVGIDCEPRAKGVDLIEEQYQLGVLVTAVVRDPVADLQRILLTEGFGNLAVAPLPAPRLSSGCLDFEAIRRAYLSSEEFSLPVAWNNFHLEGYEDYELIQCYRLLSQMEDSSKKLATLQNLGFFRFWYTARAIGFARKHYRAVLRNHGLGWLKRRKLMKAFESSRE